MPPRLRRAAGGHGFTRPELAVLLSSGAEIEEFAIRLPDGQPMAPNPEVAVARGAQMAADAVSRAFVGSTVAEVDSCPVTAATNGSRSIATRSLTLQDRHQSAVM